LYNFVYRKLVDASSQRDVAPAREALDLLEYQRETWVMLIDKLRQERTSETTPTAPASDPPPETAGAEYGTLSVQG
jgi:hypothetical protein